MARFHFCVSVLSKAVAGPNWAAKGNPSNRSVEFTLGCCLRSLLNQSCGDFVVHVGCHELPPLPEDVEGVSCLLIHRADFPRPADLTDLALYNKLSGKVLEKLSPLRKRYVGDKYSKLKLGVNAAFADPEAEFIMLVDHDDLVHRDVVEHCLHAPRGEELAPGGYHVTRGYSCTTTYNDFRELDSFFNMCGTCNAVRLSESEKEQWAKFQDVNYAFSPSREERDKHWLYAGHSSAHKRLEAAGRPMAKFPFRAAVYVTGTGANYSGVRRAGRLEIAMTDELKRDFALKGARS